VAAEETQPSPPDFIQHVVSLYGDLLHDLCSSVLWSPGNAQVAFRSILRDIRSQGRREKQRFREFERAWILGIACRKLVPLVHRYGRKLTPSEQIMLDANSDIDNRFRHFDSYFHRLPTEDQILLLLRDKYGLPYNEIASALGVPEGSLKVRRQQALRALEEWMWGTA
jgi:DNA-directed RNA polymerase specialized sigma24 family protein